MNDTFAEALSWAIWGCLIPFLCALVSSFCGLGLLSIPLRKVRPGAHWSVVARLYFPQKVAGIVSLIWMIGLACWFVSGDSEDGVPFLVVSVAAVFLGWTMGCALARKGLSIPPAAKFGGPASIASTLLTFPGLGILVGIILLTLNHNLDGFVCAVGIGALLLYVALACGLSVALLKLFRLMVPAPGELVILVRDLAAKRGVAIYGMYVLKMAAANAFAFPWTRDVAFTPVAVRVLTAAE